MARILLDDELRDLVDSSKVVLQIEEGCQADGDGHGVPIPRTGTDTPGTTLAWMGAAIPPAGLLAFRSYLYQSDGYDRGHQVVALYGHTDMELRALFLGRLVGNPRTGTAITAALHLVEPSLKSALHWSPCDAAVNPTRSVNRMAASFRFAATRRDRVRFDYPVGHTPSRAGMPVHIPASVRAAAVDSLPGL